MWWEEEKNLPDVEEMASGDNGRREDGGGYKTISNSNGDNNRIEVNEEKKNARVRYDVAQFGI